MAGANGKAEVVMTERVTKKHSVRFATLDGDAALQDLYVPKSTLKEIDRLESGAIKVTIEAA